MLLYGFLYAHLGTDSLAIMTTLGTLESILISLFFGLAVACSTLLGHRLGAEEYEVAWQHSSSSCCSPPSEPCWWDRGLAAADPPAAVGRQPAGRADDGGRQVLAIMCLGMLLKVFNMVGIIGVLRSGGDVNYSIFIDIVGMWCIGLPLAWGAVNLLGWPSLGGGGGVAGRAQQGVAGAAPYSPAPLAQKSGAGIRGREQSRKMRGHINDRKSPFAVCWPLFNQRQGAPRAATLCPCPVVV